jgi:hypothetical protein
MAKLGIVAKYGLFKLSMYPALAGVNLAIVVAEFIAEVEIFKLILRKGVIPTANSSPGSGSKIPKIDSKTPIIASSPSLKLNN